ncbi:hypothetical protein GCM10009845_35300 [Pedococcus bigeumensis]
MALDVSTDPWMVSRIVPTAGWACWPGWVGWADCTGAMGWADSAGGPGWVGWVGCSGGTGGGDDGTVMVAESRPKPVRSGTNRADTVGP